MKHLTSIAVIILLIHVALYCRGQSVQINNLFEKLKTVKQDTDKVNIYYSISRLLWNKNADSAVLMAQQSIDLAEKIHFEKGIALGLLTKGVSLVSKGKYPEALNCHLQVLRLSEKLGLEGLTGNTYNNIGIVYLRMGNNTKALNYFQQSLRIAQKDKDPYAPFSLLNNIAEIYKKENKFDSAIDYNNRALTIVNNIHDSAGISTELFNMGEVFFKKEDYKKSLTYLTESLTISKKINDREGVAYCYNLMARCYHQLQQFAKSILTAEMSLHELELVGNTDLRKESYNTLYLDHVQLKNFEQALYYRNLEIALKDSLYGIEKDREVYNLQAAYDLEKKQYQIDLLNKDKLLQEKELAKVKFRRDLFITGVILLGFAAIILYRSNMGKKKLNTLLKSKNEEVEKQNRQLEELNEIKNKIFTIISHDLRSPIRSLQGAVYLIKENAVSGQHINYLSNKMMNDLDNTGQLLDTLLFWAKSQIEGMKVNAKYFNLQETIQQNIRLMQSYAQDKKVLIIPEENTESVIVYANDNMADIVVRNLLANAIKFSKAGDTVFICVSVKDNFTELTVKDEGEGIPAADQYKIFNKSNSFTTMGTSNEKGTGFGLILCKDIVEKNGGKIWFESRQGTGSSFTFSIPNSAPGFQD